VCVTKIGRHDGQASLDFLILAIPTHQCFHSKAVPKIVQARAMTGGSIPQSDLPRQSIKSAADIAPSNRLPRLDTKKCETGCPAKKRSLRFAYAERTVLVEACKGTKRDLPNFVP